MNRLVSLRLVSLFALLTMLGTVVLPAPAAARKKKKSHFGMFGTVNGRKFSATNLEGVDDPCLMGIYNPSLGTLTFSAIECRAKRRRQGTAVKRNFRVIVMACGFYPGGTPPPPPFELQCPSSISFHTARRSGPANGAPLAPRARLRT